MLEVTAEVRRRIRRGTLSAVVCALSLGAPGGGRAQPPQETVAPTTSLTAETLSPGARHAYAELLKLKVTTCRQLLAPEPAGAPGTLLVADCADFVELLISQDASRFAAAVAAQDARLDALERVPAGPLRDYALVEIRLHQALAQLVFHHEVRAAWNLRQAALLVQVAARRYPAFLPVSMTLGLCQFGIGSLPEGYHWFLRLLGLSGSVEAGLQNLSRAAAQPHDFQPESQILLALIREAYYKKGDESLALTSRLASEQPDNLLFSYLVISLNKRQHHGEEALAAYRARPTGPAYLPLAYLHHMVADLLLYRGDYAGSTAENQQFLRDYRGEYYRKDAAFKLYLAAWLGGVPAATAERYRQQINLAGPLTIEEDAYAQRFYHDAQLLNPTLTRARLLTDGGYYIQALGVLQQFRLAAATPARDRLEAPYRRARVWQGLGRLDSARADYQRTLRRSAALGEPAYYFAPQAALQLGYLALAAGQRQVAKGYFEQALAYPRHEYKNSTDQKAKLALRGL
ncbi:tetratricopeptide repeat protein [Hymenobacter sp. UV11]|uniref:tetratricopeptide repeat protein n=1 Tax=Hymenobacter sp. UV11 TaxID=1849735 RepID=UPI00105D1D69|nr:tetratricopeptide repeat protein [Hymenobacter sp. UV11]TFZ65455.1 tetratricopeptide repeat protein [Hymenobacter sp. UV11]